MTRGVPPRVRRRIYGFGPTDVNPAPMSGFIKSYAQVMGNTTGGEWIMKCFDPPHVPAITTLASEFAVIDHWYSGLPGPTEVNRAFANSGTSHGYVRNDEIVKHLGMPQRTIFESLEDGGSSWGVYFNDFPSVGLFRYVWTHLDHLHGWSKFAEDASKGELPAYTWLEPRCVAASRRAPCACDVLTSARLRTGTTTTSASPPLTSTPTTTWLSVTPSSLRCTRRCVRALPGTRRCCL